MQQNLMQLSIYRCEWCKKSLASVGRGRKMRADKKYCSRSCRAQHANWLKRAEKLSAKICRDMHQLGAYLDDRGTEELGIQCFAAVLKGLRLEIGSRGIEIKAVSRD